MWTALILIFILYILCVIGAYKFFAIAYSKVGRWSSLNFESDDFACMLLPIFNIFYAIDYLLGNCYKK